MACGFKYTKAKLDYLTDYDMLQMIEKGIRGGYSGVLGDLHVKANNKYLDDYNPENYPIVYYIETQTIYMVM